MIKKIVALLLVSVAAHMFAANPSAIQWQRTFGGSEADSSSAVRPTSDNGYVVGGYSYSDVSGAKSSPGFGHGDFWMIKLDAGGNKQWDQTYGGGQFDGLKALQQTGDGGYLLGGVSFSDLSGNKSSFHYGGGDFWVVRVNSSGTKQWDKAFGGGNLDTLTTLQLTADGGSIIGGTSYSGASGNKSSAGYGSDSGDYWVIKLDASGNKQWEKSFGGNELDELSNLQPTRDGGYILAGHSFSGISGNKTTSNLGAGTSDYWIIKLDSNGNKQWEKVFGGDDADELRSIQQTSDGGYILGGSSYSAVSGNKSSGNFGSHDYWLVKVDASGNRQWDRSYGGDNDDKLCSVQQRDDGSYVLGGVSVSAVSGNKNVTSATADAGDYWILNVDASGNKLSEQSIRRNYCDEMSPLQSTPDRASVIAGIGTSSAAEADFAVTKLTGALRINASPIGSDRVFRVQVTGASGASYILLASTDLVQWKSIATANAVNGVVTFSDPNAASFGKRFYRVQQQ